MTPAATPSDSFCSLATIELNGHVHGPSCGHALVKHDDHFDYVGDDGELHHLLPSCCDAHADQNGNVVISHGSTSQLKRRKPGTPSPLTSPSKPLLVRSHDPLEDLESLTETKIYCEGVCCPMEVPVVNSVLDKLPGIERVDVAVVTKTVTVRHLSGVISPGAIVAALDEARLGASLTFPRQQVKGHRSWMPPKHVLVAAALLVISLLHYFSGISDATAWMEYLSWVALGSVAICLPGILLKALGALRHMVLDIHALLSIAVAGAIAIGDYTEAAVVCVLFALADFLETRCAGQARDAISAVLALKPETALLLSRGGGGGVAAESPRGNEAVPSSPGATEVTPLTTESSQEQLVPLHQTKSSSGSAHSSMALDGFVPIEVPAASVKVGSLILVRSGDKAPLDGVLVSGQSAFDESMLTGESVPVAKHPGDIVRAGTLNAGSGAVEVKTTVTSDETFVAGMARLVEQATSRQSPAETAVARFAKIYTPLVVLGCLLLAFVPWATCPVDEREDWVYLALQVLVTACPCALVLSTPATVVSALARAAQAGVLIKGGIVLETLGKVDTVTLDKTGTLTRGAFMISHFQLAPGCAWTEKQVLRLVGSLERGSGHPLAAAIVGRAAARGATCDAAVQHSANVPGCGIEGTVEGHKMAVGTSEMLLNMNVDGRDALTAVKKSLEENGETTCYIAIDGVFVASLGAKDVLRPEAAEAVRALHMQGIYVAILTGDNKTVALNVAEAAGMTPLQVHAGLMPQDKLELVASYKAEGAKRKHKVAHVGDGINDAPALASSDVGIAMGVAGAAAALEAGDVALFTNDLRVVAALHRLARAAARKIQFNIALSVVTKVVVLTLAALRMFTLWAAVLVDVGTALLVTFNGLSLLRFDFGMGGDTICIGAQAAGKGDCCASGTCGSGHKHDHSHHTHDHIHAGGCCGGHDHGSHKHKHHSHGVKGADLHEHSGGCCGDNSDKSVELIKTTTVSCCGDAEKSQPCCGGGAHHEEAHHHHHHKHSEGHTCGDHKHHHHHSHDHDDTSTSHEKGAGCDGGHHHHEHNHHGGHQHGGSCCGGH